MGSNTLHCLFIFILYRLHGHACVRMCAFLSNVTVWCAFIVIASFAVGHMWPTDDPVEAVRMN